MSPRPTIVEMSHSSPSPTGSDVTGGEMANPLALTPTPPATPSPPPHLQNAGDAPLAHGHHHGLNNNHYNLAGEEEEEPILPELHPFMPLPPYRNDMEETIPFNHSLDQVLRQVCGTNDLRSVRQLRLRVISNEMSLQRLCLHVNNLRDLTLDGSSLISLRDLGCGLSQLRKLSVARCGLDSLDGLFGLMSLRVLLAPDNSVDDIGPCSVLHYLQRIDLSRNGVLDTRNVCFLRACPNLKHLSMAGCPASQVAYYRSSVEDKLPDLLTLDGVPCHGKQVVVEESDEESDDIDDDHGGLFSGSSGDSDDEDPGHSGAGDAGARPSRAHLESLLKTPSREPLPPLQHNMAPLPPLRPLHPLPPIGSQARASSARSSSRPAPNTARAKSAAAASGRRPAASAAEEESSCNGSAATGADIATSSRHFAATHDEPAAADEVCSGNSPRTSAAAGAKSKHSEAGEKRAVSRNSAPPAVEVGKRFVAAGDVRSIGIQAAAVDSKGSKCHAPEGSPRRGSGTEKEKAKQKTYGSFSHGTANGDIASFSTPVSKEQEAPRRRTSTTSSPTKKSTGCNTQEQPSEKEVRKSTKPLTREECLTLHMEERVRRWTDNILDDPVLENLERVSLSVAEEQNGGDSSNEDLMVDPDSRIDPRPPIRREQ